MKLIFVRHGQSVYNSENRFTGWHNPPLTKTGEEQALNLVDKLNQYKIDSTYCSTLLRAKQTALIIQKNHKQISSNILYDSDLNERNYGNWSGKNKEEILNSFRQRITNNINLEFEEAKEQVKKIASLRLNEIIK